MDTQAAVKHDHQKDEDRISNLTDGNRRSRRSDQDEDQRIEYLVEQNPPKSRGLFYGQGIDTVLGKLLLSIVIGQSIAGVFNSRHTASSVMACHFSSYNREAGSFFS